MAADADCDSAWQIGLCPVESGTRDTCRLQDSAFLCNEIPFVMVCWRHDSGRINHVPCSGEGDAQLYPGTSCMCCDRAPVWFCKQKQRTSHHLWDHLLDTSRISCRVLHSLAHQDFLSSDMEESLTLSPEAPWADDYTSLCCDKV